MYRIINSLATAEFNKDIGAVEVTFNGQGSASSYHSTMDIAMNIAVIYDANRWLFVKDLFHDIDVDNFVLFIRRWSKKCSELFETYSDNRQCRVALLTTPDSYAHLSEKYDWLEESRAKFSNLHLRVFLNRENANAYLLKRTTEGMLSYR